VRSENGILDAAEISEGVMRRKVTPAEINAAFRAVVAGDLLPVPFRVALACRAAGGVATTSRRVSARTGEARRAGDLARYRSAKEQWRFFQRR
jgi:hypothetical protein